MQFLEKLRPLTLLLLRIGIGVVFMHNGHPKFTWEKQSSMHEMVESGLPAYFTYIAGTLEFGGGAVLIAGLFTRLIGFLLAGEMTIALWRAERILLHPYNVGHYELALVLGVGALAIATFGAGPISFDGLLFGEGRSPRRAKSKA
jgi:putative oxidoreductase